jgi:uncharacterized membrane protein
MIASPGGANVVAEAIEDEGVPRARRLAPAPDLRRTLVSGVLVGIGVAGFVDETVFHQLLHWHHFYDRSTPAWGLVSDGIFHAGSWFSIVIGLVLLADLRRRGAWARRRWWGGVLLGLGAFQLYDGTIQHKWLELHQIRYHVAIWPYDVAWNAVAAVALAAGVLLVRHARSEAPAP